MVAIPSDSQEVHIHVSDVTHNHELTEVGIPKTTKDAIVQLFTAGITKPNAILRALKLSNEVVDVSF